MTWPREHGPSRHFSSQVSSIDFHCMSDCTSPLLNSTSSSTDGRSLGNAYVMHWLEILMIVSTFTANLNKNKNRSASGQESTGDHSKVERASTHPATASGSATYSSVSHPQQPKLSQLQQDLQNMGMEGDEEYLPEDASTLPKVSIAKEKILEQIIARDTAKDFRPTLSMVVVGKPECQGRAGALHDLLPLRAGHVDAGKSTLIGRMLAELGELSERVVSQNQRQSHKMGKGSFAYAWAFDALPEERARYA